MTENQILLKTADKFLPRRRQEREENLGEDPRDQTFATFAPWRFKAFDFG
jgi:hypothetical protein